MQTHQAALWRRWETELNYKNDLGMNRNIAIKNSERQLITSAELSIIFKTYLAALVICLIVFVIELVYFKATKKSKKVKVKVAHALGFLLPKF